MKTLGPFLLPFLLWIAIAMGAKKKEITQVLELPKEPPLAITVATRSLVYHVSPLSAKGLLSQQTREAVKALLKSNGGMPLVAVRAFVAGTGDMRRVPAIVSEVMTDKKLALPVISVVQTGGLPLDGAQVVLETISSSRRETNTNGLLFVSGQLASAEDPLGPTVPLAAQVLDRMDRGMAGAAADVLSVTCFTSSRNEAPLVQASVLKRYPGAAINVVQTQRAAAHAFVECEAVARLARVREAALELVNDGQAAAVSAQKLAITGTQMAFGFEDKDSRLAFQRLNRALEAEGTSLRQAAMVRFYPLSGSIGEQVKRIRLEFFEPKSLPATTLLPFEGLPAMEASFAMDVTAVIPQ